MKKENNLEKFYHGSPNRDIKELEPRCRSIRKEGEGELLFAGADMACATLFLTRMFDDDSKKGDCGGVYYFVISDKNKFMELDKGGTVYVLPDANFTSDLEQWEKEWATKDKIKPLHKIHFDSSLQAMIENGVKVYFIDKKTFNDKIKNQKISIRYLEDSLGLVAEA